MPSVRLLAERSDVAVIENIRPIRLDCAGDDEVTWVKARCSTVSKATTKPAC